MQIKLGPLPNFLARKNIRLPVDDIVLLAPGLQILPVPGAEGIALLPLDGHYAPRHKTPEPGLRPREEDDEDHRLGTGGVLPAQQGLQLQGLLPVLQGALAAGQVLVLPLFTGYLVAGRRDGRHGIPDSMQIFQKEPFFKGADDFDQL